MVKKLALIIIAVSFFIPVSVAAQDMPQPEVGRSQQGQGDVQYKEETTYDFEGDDVTGSLIKPSGEGIQGEQHGKTSSLINIRSDFIPEMLKTVEEL